MLSYRRETALQGALVLGQKWKTGTGDNILRTNGRSDGMHYRLTSVITVNHSSTVPFHLTELYPYSYELLITVTDNIVCIRVTSFFTLK